MFPDRVEVLLWPSLKVRPHCCVFVSWARGTDRVPLQTPRLEGLLHHRYLDTDRNLGNLAGWLFVKWVVQLWCVVKPSSI